MSKTGRPVHQRINAKQSKLAVDASNDHSRNTFNSIVPANGKSCRRKVAVKRRTVNLAVMGVPVGFRMMIVGVYGDRRAARVIGYK